MIKLLEDNLGENIGDLGYGDDFFNTVSKAWSMKEKIDKLYLIKIKNFCSMKDTVREWEGKPQTGRKYLQKTLLIKDHYPKYTKNSKT